MKTKQQLAHDFCDEYASEQLYELKDVVDIPVRRWQRIAFLAGYNAAEQQMNSSKTLDGWISVNDFLPEPKVPVLVLFKHRITLAAIEEKEDEFIELGKFRVWKALKLQNDDIYEAYPWKAITHWMPLPKPPEPI